MFIFKTLDIISAECFCSSSYINLRKGTSDRCVLETYISLVPHIYDGNDKLLKVLIL